MARADDPKPPLEAAPPRLAALAAGGKRAIAKALSGLERLAEAPGLDAVLDEAYAAGRGHVIGITGPPGVGKSSLVDALARGWRRRGISVGIVAVDPSSRISGGALLGDRARLSVDPADQGLFMRSLASRGRLGGLADLAFPSAVLLRGLYDKVVVETVGVGQSEAEITTLADTVLLCVQPGSGDSLQFMKAGIMEVPSLVVVTKADFGASAQRAAAELKAALSLTEGSDFPVEVSTASATTGEGLEALAEALDRHLAWIAADDRISRSRAAQARHWLEATIAADFGRVGVRIAGTALAGAAPDRPFAAARVLRSRLEVVLKPA